MKYMMNTKELTWLTVTQDPETWRERPVGKTAEENGAGTGQRGSRSRELGAASGQLYPRSNTGKDTLLQTTGWAWALTIHFLYR
jgi:hypothetical protein